jgi:glycoside/pentoside/hexuronide:cation symporter, GPH family
MGKHQYENSRLIHASFGSREMFSQWFTSAFGLYTFFFYESVIGLRSELALAAFLIFAIWNAINDPLTGYLMEKLKMPWQRKRHSHRFPWILIGGIPWIFSYLLIFLVPLHWNPAADSWKIFAWYVGSLVLFDTFFTIYDINTVSLFPVKFRNPDERRAVQGWGTILGILGLVLAFVITGMIVNQTQPESYRRAALVSFGGGFLLFALLLPGVYENKRMRAEYARTERLKSDTQQPFFTVARKVLSNQTVRAKYLFFFGYQAAVALVNASALYVITYILDDPENNGLIFIMGAMLVGALVSTPLWVAVSQRVNDNKRMSVIAGFLMTASFVPMIFASTLWQWVACIGLFGVSLGGQWFMDPPTMGDVLDDAAVRTGKREQSVYYGFQTFITRFGEAFKALVIAVAHIATGFVEGAPTLAQQQAANPAGWQLMILGIRVHTAIVPAVLVLVATLVFWRRFDLSPQKAAENRKKLEEMGI